MSLAEDSRLERLTTLCLALPEAVRTFDGQHARFAVGAKTFAYYLVDHHGDGVVALCCKAAPGENQALIASDPARFFLPAYLGPKGWVSLRLDLEPIDWEAVAALVTEGYRLVAPKRLAALARRALA